MMAPGDITRILDALQLLQEQMTKLVAWQVEQKERINLFWTKDWVELKKEVHDVDMRVKQLEVTMHGVPDMVDDHDKRIVELEKFRAQMFVIATLGSMIGSGIIALAIKFIAK